MSAPTEKQAAPRIIDVLADLCGAPVDTVKLRSTGNSNADFLIATPERRFVVEYKRNATAGLLHQAAMDLRQSSKPRSKDVPLLVVPFMGPLGQGVCERAGISWLDLSGNAKITAPGLRIWVEGRPNQFGERGRPANLFAPKSSRLVRQFIKAPLKFQSQTDLAKSSALDDGYVSKLVRRLDEEGYLEFDASRKMRARNPALLLDAWRAAYDFEKHQILKGHIDARSGDELLTEMTARFAAERVEYAATGLGAAWLYTKFVAFRLVTVYLSAMPSRGLLEQLAFTAESRGANVWLVVPNDENVFSDAEVKSRIRCASPLQTYLDLKAQPERAAEAAETLRDAYLPHR